MLQSKNESGKMKVAVIESPLAKGLLEPQRLWSISEHVRGGVVVHGSQYQQCRRGCATARVAQVERYTALERQKTSQDQVHWCNGRD